MLMNLLMRCPIMLDSELEHTMKAITVESKRSGSIRLVDVVEPETPHGSLLVEAGGPGCDHGPARHGMISSSR